MKKIVLLVLFSFLLVGCVNTDKDHELILESLSNDGAIAETYEEIDFQKYEGWGTEVCNRYTRYIYKDSEGNLFGIEFSKNLLNKNEYSIFIYDNITVTDESEMYYYSEDEIPKECLDGVKYYTKDQKISRNEKYSFHTYRRYLATRNKKSFIVEKN